MDNIDSSKGLNDFLPIQDWFNEMHAKNTSQKVRAVLKNKGEAGIPLAHNVPYGYKKDENDNTKWVVDEPAAEIVKEIYNLFVQGNGTTQIANILSKRKILTPAEYFASIGIKTSTRLPTIENRWNGRTVATILDRQEYIGDTVNFRYTVRSYKDKTKANLPKEEWKIFKNTHEPIVDDYTWNIAQQLRNNRKKPTRSGKKSIFSGLLFCYDCGKKMYFRSPVTDLKSKEHYRCSSYKYYTDSCTSHYITDKVLQDIVLENVQKVISYMRNYEDLFVQEQLTKSEITVNDIKISIMKINNIDYISLTDLAKYQNSSDPSFTVKNWLRRISTIDYVGLWEQFHNANFNLVEFDQIKTEYGKNSFAMSPSQWIKRTNAIGFISKGGKYSIGTFAHPDIAFEFASWLSPAFKLYLITEFERLKINESRENKIEWSVTREITKANYLIHTNSIKEYIVPILTEKQKQYIYANEADVINVALFGMTAKEWRDKNPNLSGNIRDYTDIFHLVVLVNLENLNADMISEGISQSKRLEKLNNTARKQLELLKNNNNIKNIENIDNRLKLENKKLEA